MISTDKEFEVFDNFVSKFPLGKLQDLRQIAIYIEEQGYSIHDIEGYVDWKMEQRDKEQRERQAHFTNEVAPLLFEIIESEPDCPECGVKLFLINLKEKPGPANKSGYKSVWHCHNKECIYEKYNMKSKGDMIASQIGKEKTKIIAKHKKDFEMSGE